MNTPHVVRSSFALFAAASFAFLSGCSSTDGSGTKSVEPVTQGKLTIATGEPAYFPWVIDDNPASGEGFESAVAYAVAEELGYQKSDVVWVRTSFDSAIAPGPKDFDLNLQQYTIDEQRAKAVDFSTPYYVTSQTVVTTRGSVVDGATSIADLRDALIGVATASTSLNAVENIVKPNGGAKVFNSNEDAVAQLQAGQIDAIVVDTPVAFYLTGAVLDDGVVVGTIDGTENGDEFGIVLPKGSSLTSKVSAAIDTLRKNGTLKELETKWLSDSANATLLK